MIRVKHRKGGTRYEVYAQRAGKKVFVKSFGSEQEAERFEERHRVTQQMIADGDLPPEANLSRTFKQATEEWIESLKRSKKRSAGTYEKRLELYLWPTFASVSIARFTQASVMQWRDDLAALKSPGTVNGALIALSSAFSYFRKRQWIAVNPCFGVERVENPEKDHVWIHTGEEMTRLLLACNDELRDVVAVALGTGMRFDELLCLQWPDIDLERRIITVHRGSKGTVKSGKLRRVPILDSVLGVLKARALKRAGSFIVFPGEDGKVRNQKAVYTIYKLAVKRAQLDQRLTFHSLRHTMASHWMMDGGCIFKLSKILGHHSVKITEKVYAHLAPTAFEGDYGRVSFHVPSEPAKIYALKRDDTGKIVGRSPVVLAAV